MTVPTPTIQQFQSLPWSERRDALESVVLAEFRATLLMDDDEDLPLDESFFDLGFTSLRVTEIKQRLEDLLGCAISTNVLFNSPTVDQLMEHLTGGALGALFGVDEPATASGPAPYRALWNLTNATDQA
jgi:acyl carrier protein